MDKYLPDGVYFSQNRSKCQLGTTVKLSIVWFISFHIAQHNANKMFIYRCPISKQTPLGLTPKFGNPPILTSSNSFRHIRSSSLALASLILA